MGDVAPLDLLRPLLPPLLTRRHLLQISLGDAARSVKVGERP